MKVVLIDGVTIVGKFMATDVYFNLVLADSEEIRPAKTKTKGYISLLSSIFLLS